MSSQLILIEWFEIVNMKHEMLAKIYIISSTQYVNG